MKNTCNNLFQIETTTQRSNTMKATKAQQKVLDAIPLAQERLGGIEWVSQGHIHQELGNRVPHPNTLDAMIRNGLLIKNPDTSYLSFKVA